MSPQPWWTTDTYEADHPFPMDLAIKAGPEGVAMVRVWPDGKTDPGWGLLGKDGKPGFMHRYTRKQFHPSPILTGYPKHWAFAFVMRSMSVVCIDIDEKNGGDQHVGKLGMLPYTMAETSKSGNGYHLFYSVSEDVWDPDLGYAMFSDRVGIEQGVDIRATGCVYHYPQQRWNDRPIAELPDHLKARLHKKQQTAAAQTAAIVGVLASEDPVEVALMHDQLLTDLAKPIPAGRRNNTLFAIGQQLKAAQVPGWDDILFDRALAVGLSVDEGNKLVANVKKYD